MPQIPQYESRLNPSGFGSSRGSSPADFGGQTAASVDQLGQIVTRLGEHMTAVRDQTRLASTSARAERQLQELSFQLQNGSTDDEGNFVPPPDPRDHEKLFDERAKQIRENAKSELNDDTLFAQYEAQFTKSYGREALSLRKANIELQKQKAMGDMAEGLDELATVASQGDVVARADAVARAHGAIDAFVAAGIMDPVKGVERKKSFDKTLDVADIRRDMRNPELALQNLLGGSAYPNLDPAERQQWVNTAITAVDRDAREKRAEESRRDKEAEKAKKEVQTQTAKAGADLDADGKLTVAWVRQNRDNLDETDYRALLKSASGESKVKTNPQIYADLRLRHAAGQDITMEVNQAYLNEDITKEDFNSLTGRRGAEDGPRKQQWYEDGERFLGTSIEDNELNPNPAIKALRAELLDRWGAWADANPEATPEQARKEYEALALEARMVDVGKMRISLPVPRYATGTRATISREDVATAKDDTKAALERQEIDQDEYNRQIGILHRWMTVIQAETPKTQPGAK